MLLTYPGVKIAIFADCSHGLVWPWIAAFDGFNTNIIYTISYPTSTQPELELRKTTFVS